MFTIDNDLVAQLIEHSGCSLKSGYNWTGRVGNGVIVFPGNSVRRRRLSMCPDKHLGIFEFFKAFFVNGYKTEGFQSFHLDLIMDNITERV